MKTKDSSYNAGPKVWRFFLAYLLSAGFVWGLGWALHSGKLGYGLLFWSHFLGPVILPFAWWHYLRLTNQKLQRVDFEKEPELLTEYLKSILSMPGLRVRLWVRQSNEINFFWFQNLSLKGTRSQDLVVTSEWLKNISPKERISDWNVLWKEMAALSFGQRYLRTLQIILWMSWCSLFSPILYLLDRAFKRFPGLKNLRIAFFLQYWAWRFKFFCFGKVPVKYFAPPPTSHGKTPPHPTVWNSLMWGVWTYIPHRDVHPLWPELTHGGAFIRDFEESTL